MSDCNESDEEKYLDDILNNPDNSNYPDNPDNNLDENFNEINNCNNEETQIQTQSHHTLFGFIITRNINSELTNKYWNQNVKLIRTFYPFAKIIIIDDNSNQSLIKADFDYKNLEIIQSEYPGRGELLPFIYYSKNKWFDKAIIIHDGTFIHRRIPFEKINYPVLPLWHFQGDKLHYDASMKIASYLNHSNILKNILSNGNKWNGCFGVQCLIKHNFLLHIMDKYNLNNIIQVVTSRNDRCSLERIMGLIFTLESTNLYENGSLLGCIHKYTRSKNYRFGYTYDEYYQTFIKKRKVIKPVVKVWTGR